MVSGTFCTGTIYWGAVLVGIYKTSKCLCPDTEVLCVGEADDAHDSKYVIRMFVLETMAKVTSCWHHNCFFVCVFFFTASVCLYNVCAF